jgi:hypothetical protein
LLQLLESHVPDKLLINLDALLPQDLNDCLGPCVQAKAVKDASDCSFRADVTHVAILSTGSVSLFSCVCLAFGQKRPVHFGILLSPRVTVPSGKEAHLLKLSPSSGFVAFTDVLLNGLGSEFHSVANVPGITQARHFMGFEPEFNERLREQDGIHTKLAFRGLDSLVLG